MRTSPHRLILLCACLSAPARAAEVTDVPLPQRADIELAYQGIFEQVGLQEATDIVGIRNTQRHEVWLRGEFTPTDGVVVTVGLPWVPAYQIAYPSAREMTLDPATGDGSYLPGGALGAPPTWDGSGVYGLWFGVALTPWNERWRRSFPSSMRLDLDMRTPAKRQTLYGTNRGAGPGGTAARATLAWSNRRRAYEPYAVVRYHHEFAAEIDVADATGATIANDLRIQAASQWTMRAGTEIGIVDSPRWDADLAVDAHVGASYRSWTDRPSGFHLPDVLPTTAALTVTRSEYALVSAGTGLIANLNRWVGLRVGVDGRYGLPRRIEHAYDVRTDGKSYEVAWTLAVTSRIRKKDDPVRNRRDGWPDTF